VSIEITRTFGAFFWAMLLPHAIACALGSYMFYAQHNFPGMQLRPRTEWSFTDSALRASSYMRLGPVMQWFSGNIGYHHVHHLNPTIPFYRLPEAMAAIPELRQPVTTSLWPRDVVACLRLKLWDHAEQQMVGYRRSEPAPSAPPERPRLP
jgi:omega-6 fatty acid desaturase (delta-12 desaturase)